MTARRQPSTGPLQIGHRSPPDYTQRHVKLRLFMALAAIMFVWAVIERASNPDARRRLWTFANQPVQQARFSNRLDEPGHRTAHDPAGTIVAVSDSKSAAPASTSGQLDPVQRAWEQAWRDVFSRLSADAQSLLFELLHAPLSPRPQARLSPEKQTAAAQMLQQAQRLWEDYQSLAFQSVIELKSDDQAQWIDVLRQVNGRFANDVLPALQAIAAGRSLTDPEHAAVQGLAATLVGLAQAQIQDDTVIFRPAEREIWFHELARVHDADQTQLEKSSLGRVAYLQLHKQPADYRGKVVTVKGTVRLAYRTPAPPNYLGVKEYCVYVLQPAGGPDLPIFVYALDVPPGFPRLSASSGDAKGKMWEDVEVTGVFFKRRVYAGKGGIYTAPMLIAKAPRWHPPPPTVPSIGALELAGAVFATLFLAICIAAVLWRRTSISQRSATRQQSGGFIDLGSLALGPSPEEKIRELERQARGGEN